MTQVKFYRVETLPEVGEVGSLYFVYGSGGVQSLLYICVGTGLFELYTPDLYELENKMDSLEDKVEAESQTIQHKIDNIKLPEIDTSEIAKQGENPEATNTAIYNDTHNVALHFGITAATEFIPMTTEEIESELTTIWNNTFGE